MIPRTEEILGIPDLIQYMASGLGDTDQHTSTIVRTASAVNQALRLKPTQQSGDSGLLLDHPVRDIHGRHRLACSPKDAQHIELLQGDAVLSKVGLQQPAQLRRGPEQGNTGLEARQTEGTGLLELVEKG